LERSPVASLADDDVGGAQVADVGSGRAGPEGSARWHELLGAEALPGRFVLPDGDDAEALVGGPATCRICPARADSSRAAAG
jgi:hypothetical protein